MCPDLQYDPYNGEDQQPETEMPEQGTVENQDAPDDAEPEKNEEYFLGEYELVRPRKQSKGLTVTVLSLLLVALTLFLVWNFAFRLENIKVVGLSTRNTEDVIGRSGLVRGMNMFKANEENVKNSLGKDYSLVYEKMQKDYHAHVIYLFVHERKPVAVLSQFGSEFLLAEDGMVLTELKGKKAPADVLSISGLGGNGMKIGQVISGVTNEQMEAFRQVVKNVKPDDGILNVNLKDPADITAVTNVGLYLKLADSSYISAKLTAYRYMRAVLEGHKGILDLTIPEEAKFTVER